MECENDCLNMEQKQNGQENQHVKMEEESRVQYLKYVNDHTNKIQYYSSMTLFSANDIALLCKYKYFIQHTIMELGEDWRIQSGLLAQQIIATSSQQLKNKNLADFCIFNQFLSSYLKNRIRHEQTFINFQDVQTQESFLNSLSSRFSSQQNISQSLTFKTLSLGFVITASDVWMRSFKRIPERDNIFCDSNFQYFGVLVQLKQKTQKWLKIPLSLNETQTQWIKNQYSKTPNSLKGLIKLSNFIVHIDNFNFIQNGKNIRIFRLSNQFYLIAFIVWLIYNIKTFFNLSYEDYKKYFTIVMKQKQIWNQVKFDPCLRQFQNICQTQWNNLMKDYSIGLNDDKKIIQILMKRIKQKMSQQFCTVLQELRQKFMNEQK